MATGIPSQAEYEHREWQMFSQQIKDVEKAPLAHRREAAREFQEALKRDPELVVERIGWLLGGNYGFGSYKAAERVVRAPRMNHGAWLTTTIAALEWSTPQRLAIAAWKTLTAAEQAHLRKMIDREVKEYLAEHGK